MIKKEPMNLYRILSVVALILVTYSYCCLLCFVSHLSADEWLCVLTVATIVLLVFIFELEFERLKGGLAYNTQSNFARIVILYTLCAVLSFGMLYLPEFCRPVMLLPLLMSAVSGPAMALLTGIFFDILLVFVGGHNLFVLISMCLLTLLGAVLSEALKEERLYRLVSLLILFVNLLIPCIFYYLSYKEIEAALIPYWLGSAIGTALFSFFVFGFVWRDTRQELDNLLQDILSEDFSEVKGLKDFSVYEYEHAKRVADIAFRCAKAVGLNENLCMAGGFYYRMSRWLGEPYAKNVWRKAKALCFPEPLTKILLEYYGEEQQISSPESALVHMVDALIVKMDLMKNEVGSSQWNKEIVIYQTLNEFSSGGLYDQSGMSMNLFLKVREFLAREETLN